MREPHDKKTSGKVVATARYCAITALFVAITIAAQLALSAVPGVELVTVLFVSFCFASGVKQGMLAATAFSLLRQIIFGVFLNVLVLYLVYYNLLALCFGLLGKAIKNPLKFLPVIVITACLLTAVFTLIDNILTPLWYGYGERATRAYFMASLPFMALQVVCAAVSVSILFLPLLRVFKSVFKDR